MRRGGRVPAGEAFSPLSPALSAAGRFTVVRVPRCGISFPRCLLPVSVAFQGPQVGSDGTSWQFCRCGYLIPMSSVEADMSCFRFSNSCPAWYWVEPTEYVTLLCRFPQRHKYRTEGTTTLYRLTVPQPLATPVGKRNPHHRDPRRTNDGKTGSGPSPVETSLTTHSSKAGTYVCREEGG